MEAWPFIVFGIFRGMLCYLPHCVSTQLANKDALLASKDETITVLKSTFN
jgi:hypothetical protein